MEQSPAGKAPDPAMLLRVADLPKAREVAFSFAPDRPALAALAEGLAVSEVRKLSFGGRLVPQGKADWRLEADLGATVVQPCVVTLAPVTTRIEEKVARLYLADPPPLPEGEVEMPEDDGTEPLPAVIDLWSVIAEALALAVPPYPRAEGADFAETRVSEPGVEPMTDEDAKPFAGLKALRDTLRNDDE